MKHIAFAVALLTPLSAFPDSVTMKDGKSYDWKVMRDLGDKIEIQTTDDRIVALDKGDIREISVVKMQAALTGASMSFTGKTKSVDLLKVVDVKRDAPKGKWKAMAGGLSVDSDIPMPTILQIQMPIPDEYDLRFIAERKDGVDGLFVGIPRAGTQFLLHVDADRGSVCYLGDKSVPGAVLEKAKRRSVLVCVRKDQVTLFVDDKEYAKAASQPQVQDSMALAERKVGLYFGTYKETAVAKASFVILSPTITYK